MENKLTTKVNKFRAWDEKNKKFPFIGFHIIGEVSIFNVLDNYELEEAVELKITQFIGMQDINGKDVYEGDIVKAGWDTVGIIYFDLDYLQYRILLPGGNSREIDYFGKKIEIIGNQFENRGLVEGLK